MFTGIVEELGTVKGLRRGGKSAKLAINAREVVVDVKLGDSIAVNGVCLTVVEFTSDFFVADVMDETLKKSNLGELRPGERVNLERALRLSDRLGGHLVSGHIDGVGTILSQETIEIAVVTEIKAPLEVLRYVIKKGSVAIDGISLTVVEVGTESLKVSLIPHTAKITTLGYKRIGDKVNLEGDIVGKYIERMIQFQTKETSNKAAQNDISLDLLAKYGFV